MDQQAVAADRHADGQRSSRPPSSPEHADPAPEAKRIDDAAEESTSEDRFRSLLEIRGQGSTGSSQLLFGRLQMFTGIEYFGWLYFFFWAGVGYLALKDRSWTTQDLVLLVAALVTLVIVLSGIRKLSWSNPRYVGSTLMIAAYFAAPAISSVSTRLSRWSGIWSAGLLLALATPVGLVTAIRGAKVEITNPGTFYQDFRSMRWLSFARERPLDAIDAFFTDYFGIRKTVRHIVSPPEIQLRHAHDYFAAVQFVNDSLPEEAKIFLFRDARFFYYGERYGVVWYSPEHDHRTYYKLTDPAEMARHLQDHGFTHVLVDDYSARRRGYVDTKIGEMLTDPRHAEKIYEYGIARVYRVRLDSP